MDTLPFDIIWYHFIKHLKGFDLLFVNKNIYNRYLEGIKQNDLIMKRFERIQQAYNESISTKKMIVKFDRALLYDAYYCFTKPEIIVIAKVFYCEEYDAKKINVSLYFTSDGWKTTQIGKQVMRNCTDCTKNTLIFAFKIIIAKDIKKICDVWFSLVASYDKYTTIDNNGGWNYIVSEKYEWLPLFHYYSDDEMSELTSNDFNYLYTEPSMYYDRSNYYDHTSLTQWYLNETVSKCYGMSLYTWNHLPNGIIM